VYPEIALKTQSNNRDNIVKRRGRLKDGDSTGNGSVETGKWH
jgi:hypothetical protein